MSESNENNVNSMILWLININNNTILYFSYGKENLDMLTTEDEWI